MGSQKSIVTIVFLLSSLCCWMLYSICLILVTTQIVKDYHEDKHQVVVMKEFIALVMVPQYVSAVCYLLAILAFVTDMLSKEHRRIQFLTTTFTNATSMLFLVSAGFALFTNAAMIVYINLIDTHKESEGSGIIAMIPVLPKVEGVVAFIASWAKTLLFSLSVMLGLYGIYICYWPHSLRYRRRIDKRLLSNIENIDDDDL